jgi:hypothetical protein
MRTQNVRLSCKTNSIPGRDSFLLGQNQLAVPGMRLALGSWSENQFYGYIDREEAIHEKKLALSLGADGLSNV